MGKRPGDMQHGGGRQHAQKRRYSVVLTEGSIPDNMLLRFKNRTEISVATILLEPLREGKPVVLVVDDPRLPKRKRIEKPLLFLTPQSIYGEPSKKIVISFQTHGCEVVDTEMGVKTLELMRLGISGKMAVALAKSLNLVFNKGDNHGKHAT